MSAIRSATSFVLGFRWALAVCFAFTAQVGWADDNGGVVRLSEPVEVTDTHETFGSPMPESVESVSLSTLVANHGDYVGKSMAVEARVSKVCRKKGCFFIAQDGATVVRVSFKDYSFFVPTDIGGQQVTLMGELQLKEVSAEQAEHYAADLGAENAGIAPGPQFEIVATAVRVPIT
jgi:hypothetical protein